MESPETELRKSLEFQAGDVIMKERSLGEGLYVLMSGELDVSVNGVKVAEITAKGSYVGEIASLLRCRRIATVTARTPAKFLVIDNITRYFEQNPSAALGIAQTLAARIMDMNAKIVNYQHQVHEWIEKGRNAVEEQDISSFETVLQEMQKVLVEGRGSTEEKSDDNT